MADRPCGAMSTIIHVDDLAQHQELLPLGGQATPRGKSLLDDVSVRVCFNWNNSDNTKPCNNVIAWGIHTQGLSVWPRSIYITSNREAGRSVFSCFCVRTPRNKRTSSKRPNLQKQPRKFSPQVVSVFLWRVKLYSCSRSWKWRKWLSPINSVSTQSIIPTTLIRSAVRESNGRIRIIFFARVR